MALDIRRLPKLDLHVHLDGSLRMETVVELAEALPRDRRLPPSIDVRGAVTPPRRCTLETYLESFAVTVAVLQDALALERAAYELCEDAAREHVIYLEIRFAPLLHLSGGLSSDDVVVAVLNGIRRAEETVPIRASVIVCGMKQASPARTKEAARLAARFHDNGVVGFDLAGPERGFPPSNHREAVNLARDAGLHVTIHAGEGCCPEQIGEALDMGAERIGHGVYLAEDPALEERVSEAGIPLEVCPTSNLQISGILDAYRDHPLYRYLNLGIPITLNTDNRLMTRIDLTHEYERVIEAGNLSADQVKTLLLNGVNAAFAPPRIKDALRSSVLEGLDPATE